MKILPVSLEANSVCWCLGYQINPESGPRGRTLKLSYQGSRVGDVQIGAVTAYDDDGDGDADLFSCTATSLVRIENRMPHRAVSSTTQSVASGSGIAPEGSACFAAADFNRDGRPDVVSASMTDGKIRVYLNNGGTTITSVAVANNSGCRWVAAGDFDRDGDADIAAPSISLNRVVWYVVMAPGTNRQLFLSGWLNAPSPGLAFRVDMDWTAQGPHTLATFSLTNAPAQALETMSRSGFARFIASGSTLQQSWRYFHFKTPYDIGVAANYADPDGDGIANLSTRIPGGEEFFRLEAYEVAP